MLSLLQLLLCERHVLRYTGQERGKGHKPHPLKKEPNRNAACNTVKFITLKMTSNRKLPLLLHVLQVMRIWKCLGASTLEPNSVRLMSCLLKTSHQNA